MHGEKRYMEEVLTLAAKGEGTAAPNPLVGAVIVNNSRIQGRGYHRKYGGPHAEVFALREAGARAAGGTMYVNLEPCCHRGKTPPCTKKIIKAEIDRVVVAMKDPNPLVAGKGIDELRKAGIKVEVGLMEREARRLNEVFIKYITTELPFVYLKTAQTMDGFLATRTGDSKWITNEKARQEGHKLRHRVTGILVGIGTVMADNPRLTTRLKNGEGIDARRIILDPGLRIPPESRIIDHSSPQPTILITGDHLEEKRRESFSSRSGVEVISLPLNEEGRIPLKKLLKILHSREISSILIEGGGRINHSFLQAGLIDKIYAFIAPSFVGGSDGISVFEGRGIERMKDRIEFEVEDVRLLDDNIMVIGKF